MPFLAATKTAIPLPSAELNLGGTSTSEAQFLMASQSGASTTGSALVCYLPGSSVLRNRLFRIRVGGRLSASPAAANFTGKIYLGTSSTIASNTNIASTGAIACAGNTGTWNLEAQVAVNSSNGIMSGLLKGWVMGTAVAQAILTTTASFTTYNSESTSNGLTVTGQFSAGQALNSAYVDWFEVIPE